MSTKKSVEIKDVAGLLKALTKALSYGRRKRKREARTVQPSTVNDVEKSAKL